MTKRAESDKPRSTIHRMVTAAFGAFFILLAIGIVVLVDRSMLIGGLVAGSALGLLGVDACVAALRDRRSLLERIGPLP